MTRPTSDVRGISRRTLLAGSAGLAGVALTGRPTAGAPSRELRTRDFSGVRLLPSRWLAQQEQAADQYASVPTDDYLHGFRIRAGLPAPGKELGGWYSMDVFHNFGQIVSGLARLYAGSGRSELQHKVAAMVHGFIECIEPDGYFFYSRQPNSVHYIYEKVVCGLLDAWVYCDVGEALPALETVTEWALDPEHVGRVRQHGGGWEGEWYTLSENLYRAYLATGDPTYRDFGQVWEYRSLWDRFHDDENFFQDPAGNPVPQYHAYSHVNSLAGLGAGYQVTGDSYYLTALRKAYRVIRQTQCWATGGYGPYEYLLPDRGALAATLEPWHNHFETLCGSWAALKVSKYLVTSTGQSEYGDWAEQMLYNGVGATIPMAPDGSVQYYSAYSPRGGRKRNISPWSCCTGTRPQGIADYTDQVFMTGADRLLVNLFLPAQVTLPTDDGRLKARVVTEFPSSSRVRLEIDTAPRARHTLGFRAPGWLAGKPRLRINGDAVPARIDDRGWITATRTWRSGDWVEVDLPMDLEVQPFLPDSSAPAAVTYGPVSVAYEGNRNPVNDRTPTNLVQRTQRVPGAELSWRVLGDNLMAKPFYAYGPGERYILHLDPAAGLYIQQDGDWGSLAAVTTSGYEGDSVTCEFDGSGLRYHWFEFDNAGIVDVEIDGQPAGEVDLYGPDNAHPRFTDFVDLTAGTHTVRLANSGRKNPSSGGITINIADLALLDDAG